MPRPFPIRILFDTRDWIHRVTVQRVSYVIDDGGGNLTATVTLKRNVQCFIKAGPIVETPSSDRQQGEASHTVTFRADPHVEHGDRLIFGDRLFVVHSTVDEFYLNLIYTVVCTEITR